MTEEKNKGGRPPFYKTPEEFEKKVSEFFDDCPDKVTMHTAEGKPYEVKMPTITGLVLFMGFCDRHSFYDYENRDGFSHTVKKARTKLEHIYELSMRVNGKASDIFALKQFGWKDKIEVDNNHTGGVSIAPQINFTSKSANTIHDDFDDE